MHVVLHRAGSYSVAWSIIDRIATIATTVNAILSRPVSRLRPKEALTLDNRTSVVVAAQEMKAMRTDCALVTGPDGMLEGIITDTDITRRVVAQGLACMQTSVSEAMTRDPMCVNLEDSAVEALWTMVENRFRHLPVLNGSGVIVGVLDIAKCLFDAITRMEKAQLSKGGMQNMMAKVGVEWAGGHGAEAAALQELLGPMMKQVFAPTLSSVLGEADRASPRVGTHATVAQVGIVCTVPRTRVEVTHPSVHAHAYGCPCRAHAPHHRVVLYYAMPCRPACCGLFI